ncbi:MAG: hypothetical protein IJO74_05710 [Clostridia bacterium]|nr:hypothetical protein [Clostridia bacterium]
MIRNSLIETFGGSTYVSFVITKTKDRFRLHFLPGFSKEIKDFFRLYAHRFIEIITNNPKKIENIVIDKVKYYFSVESIRSGNEIFYGVYILYAVVDENEYLFSKFNIPYLLYNSYSIPFNISISETSKKFAEKITKKSYIYDFVYDFLSVQMNGYFENDKHVYFHKINDMVKHTVKTYFTDLCPYKVIVEDIDSNMYTQILLNDFMFYIINLLLVIVKYSCTDIVINFSNNITTLDVNISGRFVNGFFINNPDVDESDKWILSPRHPAFMDFEFVKRLASVIDVGLRFKHLDKENFEICTLVSKADIKISNELRAAEFNDFSPDIPIYTVNIDEIL